MPETGEAPSLIRQVMWIKEKIPKHPWLALFSSLIILISPIMPFLLKRVFGKPQPAPLSRVTESIALRDHHTPSQLPTIKVAYVAGFSTAAAPISEAPAFGEIVGTSSSPATNLLVGVYTYKRVGDFEEGWSRRGSASVVNGQWRVDRVTLRIPGILGVAHTTIRVIGTTNGDLPETLSQEEILERQAAFDIQPAIIDVSVAQPTISIHSIACTPAKGKESRRCHVKIEAHNLIESAESPCVSVSDLPDPPYPLSGVKAPRSGSRWQMDADWETDVSVQPPHRNPGGSLEFIVGLAKEAPSCAVSLDEVATTQPYPQASNPL